MIAIWQDFQVIDNKIIFIIVKENKKKKNEYIQLNSSIL